MIKIVLAAALAMSLPAGAAFAQASAPAAAAPTAAPMATKKGMAKPRTAQSLECSKKADAANVHGKPRSAFMRKCKSGKA